MNLVESSLSNQGMKIKVLTPEKSIIKPNEIAIEKGVVIDFGDFNVYIDEFDELADEETNLPEILKEEMEDVKATKGFHSIADVTKNGFIYSMKTIDNREEFHFYITCFINNKQYEITDGEGIQTDYEKLRTVFQAMEKIKSI